MSSEMVQLLTPEGKRVDHPQFSFDGDDELIKQFLRDMILARRFDAEATSLQRQGELGLWPPMLGQEATQIGTAGVLNRNDMVFPAFREHAIAWHLGITPGEILSMFRGTTMATAWDVEAKRMHFYTVIIGAQCLHATGYAMGMKKDGLVGNPDPDSNGAAMVFFGDGGISQGETNEAFIFAASYEAPVVFVCSNNQWAISEPVTLQSKIPLYQRARGFGFPGVQVDGNDVLAVYAAQKWAMERARAGQGPALIECYTYRMGAHTTSDDPTKYRRKEEEEAWVSKDPIERVKKYLLAQGMIDDAWLAQIEEECDDLGEKIRHDCRTMPTPEMTSIWDNVYANTPEYITKQKQAWVEYAESFDSEETH